MIVKVAENVYTFEIELPENPLRWLNCYVVKGGAGHRSLLIDSGFHRQECIDALLAGIRELELRPEDTDVFFTHLHSDHTGNAALLQSLGYRLLMGRGEYELQQQHIGDRNQSSMRARAVPMGIPRDVLEAVMENNPAVIYSSGPFTASTVESGDVLCYGGRRLECLLTPGHTPGHLCLYDRENRLLFLGDHVLFDISPNIVSWSDLPNSLGAYFESLKRIAALPVETALPAHRTTGSKTVAERVEELLLHHQTRLQEVVQAVEQIPDSSAYDLAGHVHWRIRARNWEEFPPGQKWFAVGECLAHLEYLEHEGILRRRTDENGAARFSPV